MFLCCRLPCVLNLTPLPAVLSQNVTNKSCLVCVQSKKYASLVTLFYSYQTIILFQGLIPLKVSENNFWRETYFGLSYNWTFVKKHHLQKNRIIRVVSIAPFGPYQRADNLKIRSNIHEKNRTSYWLMLCSVLKRDH